MIKETGYGLVRFSSKTGKVDTCMNSMGTAMLSLWALQNTTKTKTCLVFDLEDGKVVEEYKGSADGFPKVNKNLDWIVDAPVLEALRADYAKR